MGMQEDLAGTSENIFKIGKASIDGSNATTNRTVTLPDGDVNLNTGAIGDVLTKVGAATYSFQTQPTVGTFNSSLVNGRVVPYFTFNTPISFNYTALGTNVFGGKYAKNGRYFAVYAGGSLYFFEIRKSLGANAVIDTISSVAVGTLCNLAWSKDSRYIALVDSSPLSNFYAIYQRTGETLTAAVGLPVLTGDFSSCDWSPDGRFLAIASITGNGVFILQCRNNTFNLSTTIPYAGVIQDIEWSPDGNYLAIATDTAPYLIVYSRNDTTFTAVSAPATPPTASAVALTWHPSGAYISISFSNKFYTYSFNGTTLTKITDPSFTLIGTAGNIEWHPSGEQLIMGDLDSGGQANIRRYSFSGGVFGGAVVTATGVLPSFIYEISVSPDGSQVLFAYNGSATASFSIYNTAFGNVTTVVNAPKTKYKTNDKNTW